MSSHAVHAIGRREAIFVAFLFTLAVALRFALCFIVDVRHEAFDTKNYIATAESILAGSPIGIFPNGLPLTMVGVSALLGSDMIVRGMLILNVVLGSATVLLAWALTRGWFGPVAGLFALAAVAFWPNQLNYTRWVMSEVPTGFWVMLALWLLTFRAFLAAGLAFGIAILFRSTLLVPGALILVVIGFGWTWRYAGGFALGVILVAVLERSAIAAGWIASASNLGTNLLISLVSTSTRQINYQVAELFSPAEASAPVRTYLEAFFNDPQTFVKNRLASLWEFLGPWPMGQDRGPIAKALIGLRFPAFVLAVAALFVLPDKRKTLVLLMPLVGLAVVHAAFFSVSRFSFVAEPPSLCLMAAVVAYFLPRHIEQPVQP